MNRRIVLTGVIAAALMGGVASTASAASPETARHKLCLMTPGSDPIIPGYCITWDSPASSSQSR